MSSKTPPVLSEPDISNKTAVLDRLPVKWALRFHIFPLEWDGSVLKIAVEESFDISLIPEIQFYLKTVIVPVRVSGKEIEEWIRVHYGVGAQIVDEMRDKIPHKGVMEEGQAAQETVSDVSIGKLVEHIIRQACNERATDIHIEPYPEAFRIRYRIDGLLCDAKVPQDIRLFKEAILSRIKILASLNIAQRRLPQDGRFNFRLDDREIDCRVSVLPTSFGEAIVIRLLNALRPCQLRELGLNGEQESIFKNLLQKEHGIVFVTGPTGSGKTTTLYACLRELHHEERKIITLEDPVEYQLPGITQVQVHPSIGLSFAQGLRSMLRHDPDIMMVGEVRDQETARTAVQIALTGHLIFSTLHTNDAASAVTRLLDMGIEPYLITSAVECFVAQRLVRVLCPHCKREQRLPQEYLKVFPTADPQMNVWDAGGCEACRFTGYQGREAIYEMLVMNAAVRAKILARASSGDIRRYAVSQGMTTLRQNGWEKVLRGRTTCAEVLRVTQEEGA